MKLIYKEFFTYCFRNFYMAPLVKQYLYQPLYLIWSHPFLFIGSQFSVQYSYFYLYKTM